MQVIHPNKKTAGVTNGPFDDMLLGLMLIGIDALDFADLGIKLAIRSPKPHVEYEFASA